MYESSPKIKVMVNGMVMTQNDEPLITYFEVFYLLGSKHPKVVLATIVNCAIN